MNAARAQLVLPTLAHFHGLSGSSLLRSTAVLVALLSTAACIQQPLLPQRPLISCAQHTDALRLGCHDHRPSFVYALQQDAHSITVACTQLALPTPAHFHGFSGSSLLRSTVMLVALQSTAAWNKQPLLPQRPLLFQPPLLFQRQPIFCAQHTHALRLGGHDHRPSFLYAL